MPSPATEIDVDGVLVRITNPDKPFYPALGADGTKGKLIDYYRAVAGGPMLTALRDRPTHLQRFPDGIEGEEIYQKRIPQKHPDYLQTCTVTFPSGRTADALRCWRTQAPTWDSPNAGPVMASGAGALDLRLGGPAVYHGHLETRPALGDGARARAADIDRAVALVQNTTWLWLGVIAAAGFALRA